jgi:hypothetical protein
MQLAPQRVFQVAPVEQPGQGIMGRLFVQLRAQLQLAKHSLIDSPAITASCWWLT